VGEARADGIGNSFGLSYPKLSMHYKTLGHLRRLLQSLLPSTLLGGTNSGIKFIDGHAV
jgi:hypothetical protein